MSSRIFAVVILLTLGSGCTTIGMHTDARDTVDFGPPQELHVCFLTTGDVPQGRTTQIVAAVNEEFVPYGIKVTEGWTREWTRPGFTVYQILPDVAARELEAPCDRLVGLVDRHAGDFAWSLFLPVVLGAVEGASHTRGYVMATMLSYESIAVHEFYHLIGCPHGLTMTRCYDEIAALKASRPAQSDFFPGLTEDGTYLLTREATMDAVTRALQEETAEGGAGESGLIPEEAKEAQDSAGNQSASVSQ